MERPGCLLRLESRLSRCACPTVGRQGWPTYIVCGVAGYFAGLALVTGLALHAGMSQGAWLVLAVVPIATLLAAIGLGEVGLRRRRIVFYEKTIAALASTDIALAAIGQPIASGLDVAILGIGLFVTLGRLGCFCVACCHGRRARAGVRYRWEHAARGFPARWVGMRLFPIQLVDGAASACATAVGTAIQLSPHRAGTPLAAYACFFGASRFLLELLRGDDARPYLAGLSVAQWAAVLTVALAAAYVPRWWSLSAALALVGAAFVLAAAWRNRRWIRIWLLSAHHLAEMDSILGRLVADRAAVVTSEGLQMALRALPDGCLDLFLSHRAAKLSARTVHALAGQLGRVWTVLAVEPGEYQARVTLKRAVARDSLILHA